MATEAVTIVVEAVTIVVEAVTIVVAVATIGHTVEEWVVAVAATVVGQEVTEVRPAITVVIIAGLLRRTDKWAVTSILGITQVLLRDNNSTHDNRQIQPQ